MLNIFLILRYFLFAQSISCNAIIASVAVWNLSIAQAGGEDIPADAYLIFVGAIGLVISFLIIFIELAIQDPFTGRVWFELSWTMFMFILEISGAAIAAALVQPKMCPVIPPGIQAVGGSCISSHVLLALTWICAILFLAYLAILIGASLIRYKTDSAIWTYHLRHLPSPLPRHSGPSPAPFPAEADKPLSIVIPKPQRPSRVADIFYSTRSGLSSQYEIEHFRPPSVFASVQPASRPPAAAAPIQPTGHYPVASFYPQYMQSITSPPGVPISTYASSSLPPLQSPSQPPLGNWPRADIMSTRHSSTKQPIATELASPLPRPRPIGPRRRTLLGGNQVLPPRLATIRRSSPEAGQIV